MAIFFRLGFGYQLKPGQWGAERPTVPLILSRLKREPWGSGEIKDPGGDGLAGWSIAPGWGWPVMEMACDGDGLLQQSEMGRVVCTLRAHTTQGVSAIEILTTDLGLLYGHGNFCKNSGEDITSREKSGFIKFL